MSIMVLSDRDELGYMNRYRSFLAAGLVKTLDEYVVLMLHMDGDNLGTSFTDATGRHVFSASGDANTSTVSPKFGAASLALDGSGDYISCSDNLTDFQFGTAIDFTIDFWAKFAGTSQSGFFGDNVDAGVFDCYYESGNLKLRLNNALSVSFTPTLGVWYHIAAVRANGVSMIFVNGALLGSSSIGQAANINNGLVIGNMGAYYTNYLNGNLDEFRISKGIARWTADFTPPPSAY